jgi:hypothetical protein
MAGLRGKRRLLSVIGGVPISGYFADIIEASFS